MSERLELAKIALLSLRSEELNAIDLNLIKRVVRQYEDIESSRGLADLDSEEKVQAALRGLASELDELARR